MITPRNFEILLTGQQWHGTLSGKGEFSSSDNFLGSCRLECADKYGNSYTAVFFKALMPIYICNLAYI